MINPFKEVNWKPGLADKRKFAKSLMIGFPIIGVLMFLARGLIGHSWSAGVPLTLGIGGFVAGALFWIIPAIATPFYLLWYAIACSMGIVIGNILLGGFYFIVVTSIGLLLRVAGKCPISKGPDTSAKTYWRDGEIVADVQRYFRQY